MSMKLTITCGWCGAKEESKIRPNMQAKLPDGWVSRQSPTCSSSLYKDMEIPTVFCGTECRSEAARAEKSIARRAQEEGNRVAQDLFQREMRAALLEARGVVVALAEVAEDEP